MISARASKETLKCEVRDLKEYISWVNSKIRKHEREIAKLYTEGRNVSTRLRTMEARLKQK
jgi:chromosome segregation ATPase